MRAALFALGGLEGSNATSRFAAGTGATHRFGPTSPMSVEAQGTPTFAAVRSASESALNAAITHQRSEERRVGKSVSVRVDLGGRGKIKQKNIKDKTDNTQ